jgi:two-component system sensor histidine kinase KdpD
VGYVAALLGIAAATGLLQISGSHVNPTTAALGFLLVVLFVATGWGSRPAVFASLLGVACFNFFFLPPFGTFSIRNPDNWVAFFAFLVTALTAGALSARARRRAEEAEVSRHEIERLYFELQDTFERSSQARSLKQSERLKSALLDAVTHDLRTPLTSIKASVTTLLSELYAVERNESGAVLGNEGRKELLQVIDEEADRLDRFIEGLTKLARIDAGEMHLRRRLCSIDEIITSALKRAEPRTRSHQIEVWIDELPSLKVDESAIAEVIYTLVDNAAKYSPPNTPIRVKAVPQDSNTILVSVEDKGPGIREDLRERVFEKFFRAMRDGDIGDRTRGGTGMGLAIAHGIVQAHGGRLWIEDTSDHQGAKFVVALPTGNDEEKLTHSSVARARSGTDFSL